MGEREGCLVIEKSLKSVMLKNIKRIKRFARVHISPFSPNLEMATFYGKRNDITSAIREFLGKFSVKFLAPTGAQEMLISVHLYVCSFVCLKFV